MAGESACQSPWCDRDSGWRLGCCEPTAIGERGALFRGPCFRIPMSPTSTCCGGKCEEMWQ